MIGVGELVMVVLPSVSCVESYNIQRSASVIQVCFCISVFPTKINISITRQSNMPGIRCLFLE